MVIEKFILCLDDDTKYEFYSEYDPQTLSDLCKHDDFIIINSATLYFSNSRPRDLMIKTQNIKYILGAEREILYSCESGKGELTWTTPLQNL